MQHREIHTSEYRRVARPDHQLVDVREPDEFASGTLAGAVNIPLGSLPHRVGELDRSEPVVVLCRSGARSDRAARWLVSQGFADVTNLVGGVLGPDVDALVTPAR